LLVEFSKKYHLRAAGHSLEDVERFVKEKNFDQAARSARKAKVSFLKARDPVSFAQEPRKQEINPSF